MIHDHTQREGVHKKRGTQEMRKHGRKKMNDNNCFTIQMWLPKPRQLQSEMCTSGPL